MTQLKKKKSKHTHTHTHTHIHTHKNTMDVQNLVPASVLKMLGDKMYDKRKNGALEVERCVESRCSLLFLFLFLFL